MLRVFRCLPTCHTSSLRATISMVVESKADGREARLGIASECPTVRKSSTQTYSVLKACTGSIDAARREGMNPAMQAAAASVAIAPAITRASALVIS